MRGEMKSADKRKERGDRARADILRCSTRMASLEGLEGLTFGRVASEAGVAKSNVQVLFGDRETLQLATIEVGVDLYAETVVGPAMMKIGAVDRLIALVEGWYDFVEQRTLPGGCLIHALSNEYRTRPGDIRDRVEQHRVEARSRMVALLNDAIREGALRLGVEVDQIAFELISHQASANVAALMDDQEQFRRARLASGRLIQSIRSG